MCYVIAQQKFSGFYNFQAMVVSNSQYYLFAFVNLTYYFTLMYIHIYCMFNACIYTDCETLSNIVLTIKHFLSFFNIAYHRISYYSYALYACIMLIENMPIIYIYINFIVNACFFMIPKYRRITSKKEKKSSF